MPIGVDAPREAASATATPQSQAVDPITSRDDLAAAVLIAQLINVQPPAAAGRAAAPETVSMVDSAGMKVVFAAVGSAELMAAYREVFADVVDRCEIDLGVVEAETGQEALARLDPPLAEEPLGDPGIATLASPVLTEVSPGFDETTGFDDPITVSQPPDVFDATPEPAPLVAPPPVEGAQLSARPAIDSRFDDALLLGAPATFGVGGPPPPEPRVLINWEPLDLEWEPLGGPDIADVAGGTIPEITATAGRPRLISPTEGSRMAFVTAADANQVEDAGVADIENFLDLDRGELGDLIPGADPVNGSAIKSSLRVNAGDVLSFDVFFDAADQLPFNDFAVFTVSIGGEAVAIPIGDVAEVGAFGASGWQTITYTVPASGALTLGFAVVNDSFEAGTSRLFIDNVQLNADLGDDLLLVNEGTDDIGGVFQEFIRAPSAADDPVTVSENESLQIATSQLLANDVDPDPFDALTVVAIDRTGTIGSVSLGGDGTVTYNAAGRFESLAEGETATDSFRYIVDGGNGATDTATVTVVVTGANDRPTARADGITAGESEPLTISGSGLLANDSDPDASDRLTLSGVSGGGTLGRVTLNSDGTITYDTDGSFEALAAGETATDQFTYTITDGHGDSATATVTVTIAGDNDQPEAKADTARTNEDTVLRITPLANDSDVDTSDRLRVSAINGTAVVAGSQLALASGAVVAVNADGSLNYIPGGGFASLGAGERATDTFTYTVDDGNGGTSAATVTVTIDGANDAPVATDDTAEADEDAAVVLSASSLLANDSDPDTGTSLRLVSVDGSDTLGEVRLNGNGTVTYDPAGAFDSLGAGETATDTFRYTVDDGRGGTATATVTITITGGNDAPEARSDVVNAGEDTPQRLAVLANDFDPDATDILRISAVNGVAVTAGGRITLDSGAVLTVNADGTVTYDANGTFEALGVGATAQDTFAYSIDDGNGGTGTASVSVTVNGANDAPTANADTAPTDADAAVRITLTANDSDVDVGDRLVVKGVDTSDTIGSVRVNADGTVTYDPSGRFDDLTAGESATDTFRYVIDDGHGGRSEATVTVTIYGVDDPQPTDQQLIDSFDVPLESDFSERGLTPAFRLEGSNETSKLITEYQEPALSSDDRTFVPTHLDAMVVLTADGASASLVGGLSDIEQLLDLSRDSLPDDSDRSEPKDGAATATTLTLSEADAVDGRIVVSFDWNFISAEVDPATTGINDYAVFTVSDGITTQVFTLADCREVGEVGATGWRTSTYELSSDFTVPPGGSLTVTMGFAVVNDSNDANDSQLLVDNVRLNQEVGTDYVLLESESGGTFNTYVQTPTALADSITIEGDQAVAISAGTLLANDFASQGLADPRSTLAIVGIDTNGTVGTASLAADGTITYDPNGQFRSLGQGETATDTFTYTLTDGNGGSDRTTVTVTITGVNDGPTATDDEFELPENIQPTSPVVASPIAPNGVLNVLANDFDPDASDRLTIVAIDGIAVSVGEPLVLASGASVVVNADGTISYNPNGQFEELAVGESAVDRFTYTVSDEAGLTDQARCTVIVSGRNDAPQAVSDAAATDQNSAVTIAPLSNDSDPDTSDTLGIAAIDGVAVSSGSAITLASGAIVRVNADGTVSYDPNGQFDALGAGESATDSFSCRIDDGHGGTSTATVTVTIDGLDDPARAADDEIATDEATAVTFDPLANDLDPDDGPRPRVTAVNGAAVSAGNQIALASGALLVFNPNGTFSYDPNGAFEGLGVGSTAIDTFSYTTDGGNGTPTTATVTVTVGGLNDDPVAADDAAATDEDNAVTLRTEDLLANDSDPDLGDELTIIALGDDGTLGEVRLNDDGTIRYDPNGRFDALAAGETATDQFTYTVDDGKGGTSTATVTVTISGGNDTERLIDSFEDGIEREQASSSSVKAVSSYQETDGERQEYAPTDGSQMARLDAFGSTTPQLESFLGLPSGSLPRDTDGTFAAGGSALKLTVTVEAGDQISFDWVFDAKDFVAAPPDGRADNDYALFTVTGDDGSELFTLSDVRTTGDQGADSGTFVYTASEAGTYTIGFAVVNDRTAGPTDQNSVLLVDNVRVNAEIDQGYQITASTSDGTQQTLDNLQTAA